MVADDDDELDKCVVAMNRICTPICSILLREKAEQVAVDLGIDADKA
jgi:hypothetical protein